MPILSKVPFTSQSYSGGPYTVSSGKTGPSLGNGATIMMGGNARLGTNVSQTLSLSTLGNHVGYGSVVAFTSNTASYVAKAQTGQFNKMVAGRYLIRGFSTIVANVVSNVLATPGGISPVITNTYYTGTIRTTRINITGGWNYVNGVAIAATDATDTFVPETFPSRAIPGRICYMQGSKTALVTSYKAKTS